MKNAQGPSGASLFGRKLPRPMRWVLWGLAICFVIFVLLVVAQFPTVAQMHRSADAVAAIEAQKLTMDDVDGKHLPPPPDPAQVNATIAGIDANGNGIRDDVELAIFAKYPGQSNLKIRAAELQYAMTEQMFLTMVFDSNTWKAVAEQDDRAFQCIGLLYPRDDIQSALNALKTKAKEVENFEFNNSARTVKRNAIDSSFETSFGNSNQSYCDVHV